MINKPPYDPQDIANKIARTNPIERFIQNRHEFKVLPQIDVFVRTPESIAKILHLPFPRLDRKLADASEYALSYGMAPRVPSNENMRVDEYGLDINTRYVDEKVCSMARDLLAEGMNRDTVVRAFQTVRLNELRQAKPVQQCTDVSVLLADLKTLWGLQDAVNNLVRNYEIALKKAYTLVKGDGA